jgi:hypothetical protein
VDDARAVAELGRAGTELTLRHEGLLTAENRSGHDKGWNSALNKLGRFVASR